MRGECRLLGNMLTSTSLTSMQARHVLDADTATEFAQSTYASMCRDVKHRWQCNDEKKACSLA